MSKIKVFLDANFFIYVLQENYTNFDALGTACRELGYTLHTTTDVWHEIRMQFMRTKSKPYMTDWFDIKSRMNEFTDFQADAKQRLRSIPQVPDLGLIFAANKNSNGTDVRLVSSDYKLLDCIQYLAPNVQGMADSVFALELHEKETDPKRKQILFRIYEDIYSKEIEYSLARQDAYIPLNKIRLITDQALNVMRQIHTPQLEPKIISPSEELVDLGPGVLLVKSFENIRERGAFVEDIEAGRYDAVINEIKELQKRTAADLDIYLLTLEPAAYSALIKQISADLVLFQYFSALSRLHRGRPNDIEKALLDIEKAVDVLKYTGNPSLDLRITVLFLQTTLLILNEKFERAEQFFALIQSKAQEWGFETEVKSSEAIYLALSGLRGYESVAIPDLRDSQLVITFLLDLARNQFALQDFNQSLRVLQQVIAVSIKYEMRDTFPEALRQLILLYYTNPDSKKQTRSIMEDLFQYYHDQGWNNPFITNTAKELSKKTQRPLYSLQKKRFTPLERLSNKLVKSQMDIFCVEEIPEENAILLFVRNWELGANLGIFVGHQQNPPDVTAGDLIQWGAGTYKCVIPKKDIEKRHAARLWIVPSPDGKSEILTRGKSGFRVFRATGIDNPDDDIES